MNPFIELFRSPVETLAALGYVLLLCTLLVWTLALCWRNAITVYAQYRSHWHTWDYLPPLTWIVRLSLVPAILCIDAWALAALIWLLT